MNSKALHYGQTCTSCVAQVSHRDPVRPNGYVPDISFAMTLQGTAKLLQTNMEKLRSQIFEISAGAQRYRASLAAISSLQGALREEFDVNHRASTKDGRRQLQNTVQYQKRRRQQAEDMLKMALAGKVSNRIQNIWFIRAGLSDPSIPAVALEQLCASFPESETQAIGKTYVGTVRGAFAEVIKQLAKNTLLRLIAFLPASFGSESSTLFVAHIHDEASMRLRSYDGSLPGRIIRARSSQVQNSCVTMFANLARVEWPTELQPLGQKTGATIAKCIITIMDGILRDISNASGMPWKCARVLHVLTGDGVNTNENASKRVLNYFLRHTSWGHLILRYRMVVIRCASHQANLVVLAAICGGLPENAVEMNAVCANCNLLFKHLMPQYVE